MTTSPTTDIQPDYVMVPREPTEDMLTRGVWEITDGEPNRDDLADAYRAMLSAAPASPIPTSVANEGEREAFEAGWDARELKQTGLSAAGYADNSYDVNVAWSLYDRAPAIAALSPALDNTAVEEPLGPLWRKVQQVHADAMANDWTAAEYRAGIHLVLANAQAALSPALDNTAVEGELARLHEALEEAASGFEAIYHDGFDHAVAPVDRLTRMQRAASASATRLRAALTAETKKAR